MSGDGRAPHRGRPTVLVVDPVHDTALARLAEHVEVVVRIQPSPSELLELVPAVDAIVLRSGVRVPAEVFAAARRLRVVGRAGAGLDNIDLSAARDHGVTVFNVPGGSANAVAELALGLMLALLRRITLADRQVRSGLWDKPGLVGGELSQRTLGIVGCGGIGSRLARLAGACSMQVLTTVARPSPARRHELSRTGVELVTLARLLQVSDVVCVAVPLTPGTRGMVGADELDLMRPGAHLVNVSRGGVVDEKALEAALRRGRIAGAALDVHQHEGSGRSALADLDNVVLTPHIGAMTDEAQRRIGEALVDDLLAVLAGRPAAHRVC